MSFKSALVEATLGGGENSGLVLPCDEGGGSYLAGK